MIKATDEKISANKCQTGILFLQNLHFPRKIRNEKIGTKSQKFISFPQLQQTLLLAHILCFLLNKR